MIDPVLLLLSFIAFMCAVMVALLLILTKPVRPNRRHGQVVTDSRIAGTVTQISSSHWDDDASDWCHVPGSRAECPIHGE